MKKIYDFDSYIERRGTHCVKHDALKENFGRDDLIPLWVADMDFPTPDFIIDALHKRLEHPILGYTLQHDGYWQSVQAWLKQRHGWKVEREWMRYIPGIVKGIGMVINSFTAPGDKIIIQPPVYHPFRLVPEHNGREVVLNPLRPTADGYYEMDFEQLEQIIDPKCKILILANPHNPVGITWSRETLERLADIAVKHDIVVISDEIHCDMPLYGNRHIPFATVSENAARCSITFGAPSKTFNIAGIVSSYCIVPNEKLRSRLFAWLEANEFDMATIFAMTATEAAFTQGEEWRQQMISYIESNIDFVDEYLRTNIPEVKITKPQASYLVWMDFSALSLKHEALVDMLINKAHLAMNDGAMFGVQGEQHMRLNVGTTRAVLKQALEQLKEAINEIK
ncbi:MAG: PatB family C-S lyase [Alistipes sp.]|nr:PatB family C-S lyase [Alistipes sp.]